MFGRVTLNTEHNNPTNNVGLCICNYPLFFFVLIVSVISGCATPVTVQEDILVQTQVTAKSFDDVSYVQLVSGVETVFELEDGSHVLEMEGIKSYYAAVEIPPGNNVLTVKSYPSGMFKKQYFHPVVTLLDERSNILKEEALKMTFRSVFRQDTNHMLGTLVFEPSDEARFVVIRTQSFTDGETLATLPPSNSLMFYGGAAAVVSESAKKVGLEHAPTGIIKVRAFKRKSTF